jgi:hypothetical protein
MRITYCDRCSRRISVDAIDLYSEEPACCDACSQAETAINRMATRPRIACFKKTSRYRNAVRNPVTDAAKVSGLRRAVQAVMSLVW